MLHDANAPPTARRPIPRLVPVVKSLFAGEIPEDTVFPYPGDRRVQSARRSSAFLDSFRGFARDHVDSARIEREHGVPPEVVRGLAELGAFGMTIPEEYGGYGFSSSAYCRVTEEIGTTDASLGILIGGHQSIGMKGLILYGTEEQKKKWLPALAAGEMIAAFALTEPEAGSDAASIRTTAVYDEAKNDVRPERHQALDLQRRLRRVLHGLRQGRGAAARRTSTAGSRPSS